MAQFVSFFYGSCKNSKNGFQTFINNLQAKTNKGYMGCAKIKGALHFRTYLSSVAAEKHLPVLLFCVVYIFWSFVINELIWIGFI